MEREAEEKLGYESVTVAFYARLQSYLVKFSLIYQVELDYLRGQDETGIRREITSEAMRYGCAWVDYLRGQVRILIDSMSFDEEMKTRHKVFDAIRSQPGLTRSQLLRLTRLSRKSADDAIETLIQSETVASRPVQGKRGRPTIAYWPMVMESESEFEEV
jgi:hypothetical protein